MLSAAAQAQGKIQAKMITGGLVCDTCHVPAIYNGAQPVNYMIIGAKREDEYLSVAQVFPDIDTVLPTFSRYLVSSSRFSLDFTFNIPQEIKPKDSAREKHPATKSVSRKPLQFLVYYNHKLLRNWTDINSLNSDKDFLTGVTTKSGDDEKFTIWENYHAGNFALNVKDSLLVLIRDAVTRKTVDAILIRRILFYPKYFDFTRFSTENILNVKMNDDFSAGTLHNDSIDNFEMTAQETGLFRIKDSRIPKNEFEYAFKEEPTQWKTLSAFHPELKDFGYIIINKPTPGRTIELLLRYKQQRESIHRIKIKVSENLTSTTWFKITATLTLAALSFTVWYAFKRKMHVKQLAEITLKNEEIESKLALLSGQLNPHFLFNSLNSLQTLINKKDTQSANLYLLEVSSFLRAIMDAGKKEYISLQEELSMEEAYINLEQKRKGFTYNLVNNCSSDLSQIEFPPLLLQPVIENCIHHGLSRNIKNPLLTVHLDCFDKKLIVAVEDNGHGFNQTTITPGHGLALVQKRISLLNARLPGMRIQMDIVSTGKGTITTFTFESWI